MTCFRLGILRSARLVVGLNDIKVLFQPKNGSMILKHSFPRTDTTDQCQGGQSVPSTCPSGCYRWHLPAALQSLLALFNTTTYQNQDLFPYFLEIISWPLSKSLAIWAEDRKFAPLIFGIVQSLYILSWVFIPMSVLAVDSTWDGIMLFSPFLAISAVWGFPLHITQ